MWPDTDLFHYTSYDAFLSIIRNRAIWASNIGLLNDEKEYLHTVELLQPYLEDIWKKSKNKNLVEHLTRLIENAEGGPTYVSSFSENPDLLSQWRAYCRDGGCSIGFKKDEIRHIADRCGIKLVKCNYAPSEQKRMVSEFAEQLASLISSEGKSISDGGEALRFHAKHVYSQVNMLANLIKHPSFQEEQEWRFFKTSVYANHPNLKYRTGKGMLIPYYEIDLVDAESNSNKFPAISEIYIAPHKNSELSVKTMRTFLAGEGARCDERLSILVKNSYVPYREI